MDLVPVLIAALIFPGLPTALALGLVFRALARGRVPGTGRGIGGLGSREGVAAVASIGLAGLGLACMPWPLRPGGVAESWLWGWAGFELAFLAPLLPALLAGPPRLVRAAIREAQIGALARALLWAALAVALAIHANWQLSTLPAHLIALAAAMLCLPAAIGWGPFATERGVTPDGVAAGLPAELRALDDLARDVRAGALLAAVTVATLPTASGPAWLGLAVIVGGFLVGALILRRIAGWLPRLPLPTIVRLGLLAGAPLVAVATIALALGA